MAAPKPKAFLKRLLETFLKISISISILIRTFLKISISIRAFLKISISIRTFW